MNHVLFRFGAVWVATALLALTPAVFGAAAAPAASSASPTSPEQLSQAELLKAYLQLREQLHATQLAIATNRAEAEAATRAQAAALAERLEAIKLALQAERDRQQREQERQQAERDRQQAETERMTRLVLWVGAGFAVAGLLAMILMPLFQARAINRLAEATVARAQLAAPAPAALLAGDAPAPSDQAVTNSNQRLLSVIDRMEKRILELEHTAGSPLPAAPVKPANGAAAVVVTAPAAAPAKPSADPEAARRANDQAPWIAVLMNKARSLLGSNKALEAVACYDEILKLDPAHAEALVRKGSALERLNRFEEAIACYERAIEADRKLTLAYLHKAAACNRAGRYEEAVECFEQALQAEERRKPAAPA